MNTGILPSRVTVAHERLLMGQLDCLVNPMKRSRDRWYRVACLGSIQTPPAVVVRMVSVVVLVQIMMRIKRLVRVVGMTNMPWNPDRRHVHAGRGLVRIPLCKVILEQRLCPFAQRIAVSLCVT